MAVVKIYEGGLVYPTGIYAFRVNSIAEKSGVNGPYLMWESEILSPEDFVGSKYRHISPLNVSLKSKYLGLFLAVGAQGPDEGSKEIAFDTDDFIGAEFYAELEITVVKEGENKGTERNEIKNAWSPEAFEEHRAKTAKVVSRSSTIIPAAGSTTAPSRPRTKVVTGKKLDNFPT